MTDHLLNTLGLALRSGSLAVGEDSAAQACTEGKARLLLIACDAAENTADKAARLAGQKGIPLITLPHEKSQVGFHLGRSVCALLAVTDAGFAASIVKRLAAGEPERYSALAEELAGKAKRTQRRKQKKQQAQDRKGSGAASSVKPNRRWPI